MKRLRIIAEVDVMAVNDDDYPYTDLVAELRADLGGWYIVNIDVQERED
jgi:hypothetical protein